MHTRIYYLCEPHRLKQAIYEMGRSGLQVDFLLASSAFSPQLPLPSYLLRLTVKALKPNKLIKLQ